MRSDDRAALVPAVQILESMNLATRISQLVGMPIEKAMSGLHDHWSTIVTVTRITKVALGDATDHIAIMGSSKKGRRHLLIC